MSNILLDDNEKVLNDMQKKHKLSFTVAKDLNIPEINGQYNIIINVNIIINININYICFTLHLKCILYKWQKYWKKRKLLW